MVETMVVDHFYMNYNHVYQHPLTLVETSRGTHVVVERFYRPACREWIERSMRIRYNSHDFRLDKKIECGTRWHDLTTQPVRCYLQCSRSNPTWEISYEDWQRALDDPEIWSRLPG